MQLTITKKYGGCTFYRYQNALQSKIVFYLSPKLNQIHQIQWHRKGGKFCSSAQWPEGPPLINKMSYMHHVILKSKIFLQNLIQKNTGNRICSALDFPIFWVACPQTLLTPLALVCCPLKHPQYATD